MEIFHDAGDNHYIEVTLSNLARLWQASGDTGLPAAVAGILGVSPGEVEALLRGENAD